MLAIIVVVLAALAVVSIAFTSYLSMVNSSNQMTKALEERRLINDWAVSIQQAMRPFGLDRQLVVPNGEVVSGNDYMLPPQSINLQTKNSWGRDIMYCPFSLSEGSGSSIILAGDGDSYSANTVVGTDGIEYVYSVSSGADPTGTDMVAAIISPIPSETNPSCSDIRYDGVTGNYYVLNYDGVVYPVVYSALVVSNQAKSIRLDSDSSDDLSELVSDWESIRPDTTNITLESRVGDYLTSSISFINENQPKTKYIQISGSSPSQSKLNGTSSSIVFENVTVNLNDMSFGSGVSVSFINSEVSLDNVVISNVSFNGSNVFLKGSSSMHSGSVPLEIVDTNINGSLANLTIYKEGSVGGDILGSKLSVNNLSVVNQSSNGVGLVIGDASSIIIGQSLTTSGSYMNNVIGVASGGSFNASNINININSSVDTFLFNQGDVYLDNVFINFNSGVIRGIIIGLNSDTVLNQVQIGSDSARPSVGVEDVGGAKFIGGFNTLVYGQASCWTGDIFDTVIPSANGSTSEATLPSAKSSNRSIWNCNI